MLINLVGCDGCGKTTQVDLLVPWIERQFGCPVRVLKKKDIFDFERFPDSARLFGCSYRVLMYEVLPRMKRESRALFLFYMLSLSVCEYPPTADEVVLLDGGWAKHVATEAAMGLDEAWLSGVASGLPVPDVSVLLEVRPEVIVDRRKQHAYGPHAPYECGCTGELSDASFVAQMSRTAQRLAARADSEGWHRVDGEAPTQVVFERVQQLLRPRLAAAFERRAAAIK
jgi:thymidylate kinase